MKKSTSIFWLMTAIFIILILGILSELFHGQMFLIVAALLIILAIALVIFTHQEKLKKQIKKYYLLSGYSIIGMVASIVLHNLFYALAEISKNLPFIQAIMEGLHVVFFLIAIPIAPLVFIYSLVRVIIILIKK